MAEQTKKGVQLVDTLRWTGADGAAEQHDGKGATVELPADEFDRLAGKDDPPVASPRSAEAKDAKADAADEA